MISEYRSAVTLARSAADEIPVPLRPGDPRYPPQLKLRWQREAALARASHNPLGHALGRRPATGKYS